MKRMTIHPARHLHARARVLFPLLGIAAVLAASFSYARDDRHPRLMAFTRDDAGGIQVLHYDDDRRKDSYALVGKGSSESDLWGMADLERGLAAARRSTPGDFLWIRRDGKEYVVTDAATVARAREAWREPEAIGDRMEALGDQMEVHGERMEVLGERMERLAEGHEESSEAREAARAMEVLGDRMEELADRQAELTERQLDMRGDIAETHRLGREIEAIGERMTALGREMERHAAVLEAEHARHARNREPMDALAKEMERASEPMEALGEKMEALGREHEQASEKATRAMDAIIRDAIATNVARPVQAR